MHKASPRFITIHQQSIDTNPIDKSITSQQGYLSTRPSPRSQHCNMHACKYRLLTKAALSVQPYQVILPRAHVSRSSASDQYTIHSYLQGIYLSRTMRSLSCKPDSTRLSTRARINIRHQNMHCYHVKKKY